MSEHDFASSRQRADPARKRAHGGSSPPAVSVHDGLAAAHLARTESGQEGFYVLEGASSDQTVRTILHLIERQKAKNGE